MPGGIKIICKLQRGLQHCLWQSFLLLLKKATLQFLDAVLQNLCFNSCFYLQVNKPFLMTGVFNRLHIEQVMLSLPVELHGNLQNVTRIRPRSWVCQSLPSLLSQGCVWGRNSANQIRKALKIFFFCFEKQSRLHLLNCL